MLLVRFVPLLSVLAMLAFQQVPAKASGLYLVEDVPVDVTSDSAVAAREQAFAEGRRQAFALMLERLSSGSGTIDPQETDDLAISALIDRFDVTNEQVAPNRYKASFTVAFNQQALRRFLDSGGHVYSAAQAGPVLVLPYYQQNNAMRLWQGDNPWREAWAANRGLRSGRVPVILPIGDAQDLAAVPDNQPLQYDLDSVLEMAGRYNAEEVVIAMYEEGGQIHLYNAGGMRPVHISSLSAAETDYEEDVSRLYAVIQDYYKNNDTAQNLASGMAYLAVTVPVQSLQDWIRIKQQLEAISVIERLEVGKVAPGGAEITLHYAGSYERLVNALRRYNYTIETPMQGGGYYDEAGFYHARRTKPVLRRL